MISKAIIFLVLPFCTSFTCVAQRVGFQIGSTLVFGSKVNAIGLNINAYYTDFFYQLNLSNNTKIAFTSYGNRKQYIENRFAGGLILLAGKKTQTEDFQLDALIQNTKYDYALGFNYILYNDNIGTSQLSGAWSITLKKTAILFENDVFGGQARDRFRSGIMQVNYRYRDNLKLFVNLYIWTGETKGSTWIKTPQPSCPNGYRSLEKLPFGKTSHGILSFGGHFTTNYMQQSYAGEFLTLKGGLDSEQIRHFVQNRISHDLIFMPQFYKRNTPHYPRLNEEGKPIFNRKDRRKDRFYFQASLNDCWSD